MGTSLDSKLRSLEEEIFGVSKNLKITYCYDKVYSEISVNSIQKLEKIKSLDL